MWASEMAGVMFPLLLLSPLVVPPEKVAVRLPLLILSSLMGTLENAKAM